MQKTYLPNHPEAIQINSTICDMICTDLLLHFSVYNVTFVIQHNKILFLACFSPKVVSQLIVHRCTIRWKRQLNLWWDKLSFVQLTSGQENSPQMHICPWEATVPCGQGGRCCNMTALLQMDLLNEGHILPTFRNILIRWYISLSDRFEGESQWMILWLIIQAIWSGLWLIMTTSVAWHIT